MEWMFYFRYFVRFAFISANYDESFRRALSGLDTQSSISSFGAFVHLNATCKLDWLALLWIAGEAGWINM